MRLHMLFLLLVGLTICVGCGRAKSTDELLTAVRSGSERERIIAVRLLPDRKADAAKVVPALIECLRDKQGDVRLSAIVGLGTFGAEAKEAVPELQTLARDRDARLRRAAVTALSRIDPTLALPPDPGRKAKR